MKKKPITERKFPAGKRGEGRVQFFSLIDQIKEAIDSGWTAKAIWQELSDNKEISIQYATFIGYVRTHISSDSSRAKQSQDKETIKHTPKQKRMDRVSLDKDIQQEDLNVKQRLENKMQMEESKKPDVF